MKRLHQDLAGESNVLAVRSPLRHFFVWGAYFALVFAIAFHDGTNIKISPLGENISILATNSEMISGFGHSDAANYAAGARQVFQHGWFKDKWFLALWPPGYFLLQAGIMFVAGESAPVPAILLFLTVALWSVVLYSSYLLFRRYVAVWLAFLLPVLLVVSAFARIWFFRHGVVYTEGMSTGLWLLGISWIGLSILNQQTWLAAAGGATMALAAYFRNQAEMSGNLMCGAVIVAFLLVWAINRRRAAAGQPRPGILSTALDAPWKLLFIACVAFFVCTLPWRIHNYVSFGDFSWHHLDYYWKFLWMQDEEFAPGGHAAGAAFLMPGRVNVACHVFPQECAQMRQIRIEKGESIYPWAHYKEEAFRAFTRRPLSWTAYKLEKLPTFWFSVPTAITPFGWQWIEGSLTALASLVGLLGVVLTWGHVLWPLIFSSAVAVYGTTLATILFVHLDVRYLYFTREFSIYLAVLVVAVSISRFSIKWLASSKASRP